MLRAGLLQAAAFDDFAIAEPIIARALGCSGKADDEKRVSSVVFGAMFSLNSVGEKVRVTQSPAVEVPPVTR